MSEACGGSATATAHAGAQHSLRADGPKIHSARSGLLARLRYAVAAYAARRLQQRLRGHGRGRPKQAATGNIVGRIGRQRRNGTERNRS